MEASPSETVDAVSSVSLAARSAEHSTVTLMLCSLQTTSPTDVASFLRIGTSTVVP